MCLCAAQLEIRLDEYNDDEDVDDGGAVAGCRILLRRLIRVDEEQEREARGGEEKLD